MFTDNTPSRPPTGDECNANTEWGVLRACWYPQMGGYSSKCWVELYDNDPEGCFDMWVYHDGTFPFDSKKVWDAEWGSEKSRNPARIHHCSSEQFIKFGQLIRDMQKS